MPITLPVEARADDRSFDQVAGRAEKRFAEAGRNAGQAFSKGLGDSAQGDKWAKAYDKVADAAGKLRVEQQKLNELNDKGIKDSRLISQVEKVEAARRREAAAVREATRAYQDHDRSTAALVGGLNRVNSAASMAINGFANLAAGSRFGALTQSVAGLSSGLTAAGASVGTLSAALAGAAGVGVGAFLALEAGAVALTNSLYDMGSTWDSVFDNIRAKTGLTGPALEEVKQSVRDVAGSIPQDLGVIGDIATQVAQSLKLTGDAAEPMITSLGTLKSVGIESNVRSLGEAFRSLDVDQGKYIAGLEKLTAFSQSTGLSIDDVTGAIAGGKGAIDAFGLTIDDVLNLMSQFQKEGMSPDQGISALNKAFAKLTEAGKATKEGLSTSLSEIKAQINSGDLTGASERLNNLFGAKGGGGSWLKVVSDDAFSLTAATEAPRASIQGLADDTYDLAESWQMLKNDLQAALEPLASGTFSAINEALQGFGDWFSRNRGPIIGFFTFAATQALNFAQVIVQGVGGAMIAIGELGEDLPFVGDKFRQVREAGQKAFDFGEKLDELQGNVQALGDRANESASFLDALGDNVKLLPDKKTVVLEDNSAEALDRIDSTKYAIENLPDGSVKVVAKTDEATREMNSWIDQQNGKNVEPPVKPDLEPANIAIDQWKRKLESEGITIPIDGSLVGVPVPGSGPVTNGPLGVPGGMHKFSANRYEQGMVPNNRNLMDAVTQVFGVKAAADTGRKDWAGEHGAGEALDIMVNPGAELGKMTAQGQAEGARINQWLLQNAREFGLRYTIWQGKQWNPDGTTAPNSGQGVTGGHWDHVHARVSRGDAGGMRRFSGFGPRGGMDQGMPYGSVPLEAGTLNEPSPLPPGTHSPIPGLKDGPVGSTFGYNDFGEPGYYRPDPKAITNAERAKRNADESVADAEERVTDLETKLAELNAQKAKTYNEASLDEKKRLEDQLASTQDSLENARRSARNARESAGDASTALDEARRGRFSAASQASRSGGRSGGSGMQIGAPIAGDFGFSGGLPGIAENLTNFLANLGFAPALGALSGIGMALDPYGRSQGGGGLLGMGAALSGFGIPSTVNGMTPSPIGVGGGGFGGGGGLPRMSNIFGGPLGAPPGPAGMGAPAAATPTTLGGTSPGSGPGGGGFGGAGGTGLGGMAMQGIQAGISAAGLALDSMAPGAGTAASIAANMGVQLGNRAIGQAGKAVGITVGGLLETFLPANSKLADPGANWFGRIAGGFAGAKPALPNTVGQPADKPTSQQPDPLADPAAAQQSSKQSGGPGGGVTVNYNNYQATEDRAGADLTTHLMAMNSTPGL